VLKQKFRRFRHAYNLGNLWPTGSQLIADELSATPLQLSFGEGRGCGRITLSQSSTLLGP
jgi:hypothetical protein